MEDSERWRAVGRIEAGQSITDVALFFGVHHSAISRLWKQFETTKIIVRRPVGGRPRVTTSTEDRYIAIVAKRNRRATSTRVTPMVTASTGKAISAATICRRLHMNGLYARVPRVCVLPSGQSRGVRLKWCREHGNRIVSDWDNIMFTDESRFALEPADKSIRIWRKQGTRNQPQNITEDHASRGGSIMVWAGISLGYRTDLHIFKRGLRCLVSRRSPRTHFEMIRCSIGPTFVLTGDNARPHRADIIDDYMESEGITRMAWSAYSPDLNPIENLWDVLGRVVPSRFPPPATLIELEIALQEEWRLLNSAVADHLIESMVRRCKLCIQMRRDHIPY
ncbi:transposable element Tcb1 transposase [Trichonephila clavipes]|uniref:Transposable element Tcb1 transposase n=1 Tax=Trichonephila clavipes TaxID=2585209 RepID=A0A8X6S5H9_TRICX|nr:transposable element Tcb1 transposase [Trichonephila clavipes]